MLRYFMSYKKYEINQLYYLVPTPDFVAHYFDVYLFMLPIT